MEIVAFSEKDFLVTFFFDSAENVEISREIVVEDVTGNEVAA